LLTHKKTYPLFRKIFEPESTKPVLDKEISDANNYVRTHRETVKVVILVNESL